MGRRSMQTALPLPADGHMAEPYAKPELMALAPVERQEMGVEETRHELGSWQGPWSVDGTV